MVIERTVAGVAAAGAVALLARRTGSLSTSGAVAATITGTVASAASWGWGALLIGYFAASSLLTRMGAAKKAARTGGVVEKGGARDAWQVAANGGLFALAALATVADLGGAWSLVGAAALASAAADTWSTEIGSWLGGTPRSIVTLRAVTPGTSGGITWWGSFGAALGAAFVAALAVATGTSSALAPSIIVGGVAGAFADSLLGAAVQARRRCPACGVGTERRVHDCGTATVPAGGISWMDNDAVNFAATGAGALVAIAVYLSSLRHAPQW